MNQTESNPPPWRSPRFHVAVLTVIVIAGLAAYWLGGRGESLADMEFAFMAVSADGPWEIHVIAADGSNRRAVTDGEHQAGDPQWSPDGSQIAYVAQVGRVTNLMLTQAEGGEPTNISGEAGNDRWPDWSPDGEQLVYASQLLADAGDQATPEIELLITNATDPDPATLIEMLGSTESAPAWSPDGSRIAFHSSAEGNDIYTVRPDGTDLTRLTEHPGLDRYPVWSPDSRHIAYTSAPEEAAAIFDVMVLPVDEGSEPVNLSSHNLQDLAPAWSPDGSRIAWMTGRHGQAEIYVADPDGGDKVRVTDHPADDTFPTWSPDGQWLAFVSNRRNAESWDVWLVSPEGGEPRLVVENVVGNWRVSWRPTAAESESTTAFTGWRAPLGALLGR